MLKDKKKIYILACIFLTAILATWFILITSNNHPEISSNGYEISDFSNLDDSSENSLDSSSENPVMEDVSSEGTELNAGNEKSSTGSAKTSGSLKGVPAEGSVSAYNLPSPLPVGTGKAVVGYYTSWSRYYNFYPENVNISKVTHLNYAFANVGSDLKVSVGDSQVDYKNFEAFVNLKKQNNNLRTLISVGGWSYSKYFSDAASNLQNRETFAQSCLDFALSYGFDGIDIDWEYPVSGGDSGNIYRNEDKKNFTLLLKAVRNKLDEQSKLDGRTYYLTITGAPSFSYINNVEVKNISSVVDYIFIMGYDFHGPWDKYADLNSPLYTPSGTSPQSRSSIEEGVDAYLNTGVSPSKLVLGMPFYGYKYNVSSSENNGFYSPFISCSSISYDNIASNFLNNPSYKLFYHEEAKVPYLFGNNTFISFDNANSIAEKVKFAKSKRLSGVGAWELSFDRNFVLLNSAYSALYN